MKIKRVYLKNYIGIYKGGGIKEIELNFNDKNIILLVGENGSGKTSLMEALTPMPDNKCIRPKKDGIKEIELEEGMYIYKIQHFYKANGKSHKISSFIQKIVNGKIIELNENGNVTSFKEIIKDELGINDEYISLLRLGYSFSSFVSKTTSERSKFISTFLSEISIYLKYYKKVNDDSRVLKNIIKNISTKLDNIGNIDELKSKETKTIIDLSNANKLKNENIAKKLYLEKSIEDISIDKNIDIDIDEKMINIVLNNIKILGWQNIKKEDFIMLEKERFSNISHKMDSINNNISSITKMISEYDDQIEDLDSHIESIDEKECNNIVSKYNSLINLKTLLDEEYGFSKEENIPRYTKESLFESVSLLDEYLEAVEKIHGEFDKNIISEAIIAYSENRNLYNSYTSMQNEIDKCRNNLASIIGNINSLETTYKSVCENECKKPTTCVDSNCPLIGGNSKDIKCKIDLSYSEKLEIEEYIKQLEKDKEKVEQCISIVSSIRDIEKAFKFNKLIFDNIPFIYKDFKDYIKIIEMCKPWYENNQLEYCNDIVEGYDKWKENDDNINSLYKYYIEALEDIKSLESMKSKLTNVLSSKKIYEDKLQQELNLKESISEEYGILEDIQDNKNIYLEVIEYKDNLDKIKEDTKIYNQTMKEIDRVDLLIDDMEYEINRLNKLKDNLSYMIIDFNKLQESKKLYDKKYLYVKLIKDALSSNKGIPLIYIDLYLEQARLLANDLLKSAFGDKYQLSKFVINDKEFKIPFLKNDELIEDVLFGSEGEKSILSLALSFAFIHQISSKFNIMFLDEVDGPLDKSNRKNFAFAVEKQMEFMGMEQIFIITHNDSFLTKNVGYILLKGYDMDKINKENIIYEY